ncbi:hypothetical protein BJV78DRAFT_1211895 [Lactifluus subvellereus]|nr:hypothetical protein BJV78DRAFT_1211895 [Lactifluus subvellereus]
MPQINHLWRRRRRLTNLHFNRYPRPPGKGVIPPVVSSATPTQSVDPLFPFPLTIVDDPTPTSTSSSIAPLSSFIPSSTSSSSFSYAAPSPLSSSSTSSTTPTPLTTYNVQPVILTTPTTTTPSSASKSTSTFIQTVANHPAVGASSSVTPSATASPTPVGGASTGVIAGGILAAVLGAAGILAAVVYFLRRCRRSEDEAFSEEVWNRTDARRHSAILADELGRTGPVRPYNAIAPGSPRPPTMIERHLNNAPAMLARQPTLPNMYPNTSYGNGYGVIQYTQPSFSPGDIVSPTSTNPHFSPYAQDVMVSPVSSNVPDYYHHNQSQSASPAAPPQAFTRQPSNAMVQAAVARQNSVTSGPYSPVVSSPDTTDPNYADLSRSSVTPFQAAQYAEITKKLGMPMSLVPGAVPEDSHSAIPNDISPASHADIPLRDENAPTESPFADPGTERSDADVCHELDIESPLPSPTRFQHTRIPSSPPTLPEIRVPERSFSPVTSYEVTIPSSVHNTPSPFSLEFTDLRTPPPAGLQHKSSPLVTSSPVQAESAKRPDTVYDEEDAYGGI